MMQRARMHAFLSQNGQELSPWLLVAAAGAVVLVILLLASPLLRRRHDAAARPAPPAQSASTPAAATPRPSTAAADYRAIERDIQNLMTELSEMTRRASAQFDARAANLERLLREADDREAKLAAKLAALHAATNGDTALSPPPQHQPPPAIETTNAPAPSPDDDVIDPRHVEIYTLCEQGLSSQQIADRLRRPSGEVELIIALRPRRHALGSSHD
ncbi:MAG: hypothetical protein QOF78_4001 [Phycisphaerales bacterium]|jgi:hypothetical protein|nr:hypothetical protein [Phycisphaerales bacterium]